MTVHRVEWCILGMIEGAPAIVRKLLIARLTASSRDNRNLLFYDFSLSVGHVSRLFAHQTTAFATYNNTIQRKSMRVSFSDAANGCLAGVYLGVRTVM
ncbi:hypothetical protein [Pseudomonas frederiksbergensis]|uniref:Uncharacterized protein n=1 Tax=Pseudomonas frederiksbergensis TaxID=104087 RepID=A0A423HW98_9PSED|nr:hypothetical protein [Pseudomonas frederiksbergensis]RON17495.1 hypothetical protein BK662_07155 [Pseudomonas frederiksbergensis]